LLVTKAISGAGRMAPPPSWIGPLRSQLASEDDDVAKNAISAVASLRSDQFTDSLQSIADDPRRSISLRMDALSAVALRSGKLDDKTFQRLIEMYEETLSPTTASRVTQIIGAANLTAAQLDDSTQLLKHASPSQLRDLMRGFQRKVGPEAAQRFLDAIESADALMSLAEHELSDIIKRFPPQTLDHANRLLDRLKDHHQQKVLRLESLRGKLAGGDATRGEQVFMGEKSKCSSCHRVGKKGKAVGPDLTTIGANRSASDLLESIVFPSASIVRDYESHKVLTADGHVLTGLVIAESTDTIELQQSNGDKVKIHQDDVEQISASSVSVMPAGLDEALTEQDMLDVVRYLQDLTK
jgi:putative heme-binding domain-containing protein